MQSLQDFHGLPTVKRSLRYLAVALASNPDTADLAQQIRDERARLQAAEEKHDTAYESWLCAAAVVRYLDKKLDKTVLALSRDTFALVNGNRRDPRYQKLFLKPPTTAMKGIADDPQEMYVRAIISTIEKDDDFTTLRTRLPRIVAELGELKTAVESRNQKRIEETTSLQELRLALEHARRTYNLMHPRLQLIFPDDPDLVETFFRELRSFKADDEGEAPPAEPPGGPGEPQPTP
jgi:hypothetical protein